MKQLYQSFTLAFAMYSRIPMPRVEWTDKAMRDVFCFFPAVGVACGGALGLWFWLTGVLGVGSLLFGAVCALLPLALTGGIHLDGFCDTCDALGSHQSRERKLEILKDSHVGAFALIGCVSYLLLLTAAWSEVRVDLSAGVVLALIPVLSRTGSGLCAVTMKNARGSGLLATFTDAAALKVNRGVLGLWLIAAAAGMLLADWKLGLGALIGWGLTLLAYRKMAKKEFGGITGDLEGWFLQMSELVCLLCVVLVQKGVGLL